MSGQPVTSASDQNRFRNEYLETLNLQAEINDTNLQANKNYLMTGQLPTVSQMIDTRTTTEKLEDINKLKQDIIDKLQPIADAATATAIVNKIINNPLNVANAMFRFFAQRVGEISIELKKIYPYGVSYEPSDIDGIVLFIQNMYSETQGKLTSFRTYMNTTSSTTSGTQVVSADNLSPILTQLQHIARVLLTSTDNVVGAGPINDKVDALLEIVRSISYSLPSSAQMSLLNKQLTGTLIPGIRETQPMGAVQRQAAVAPALKIDRLPQNENALIKPYFKLIEKLPKFNAVETLIKKVEKFSDLLINDLAVKRMNAGNNPNALAAIRPDPNLLKNIHDGLDGLLNLFAAFDTDEAIQIMRNFVDTIIPKLSKYENIYANREEDWKKHNAIEDEIRQLQQNANLTQAQQRQLDALTLREENSRNGIRQMYGEGITQPKRRVGRPRGCGIVKVEKPPMYVGFGINEINRKKMNEKNILTVRRNNSRTNIPDFPSRHISDGFKNVLNTITGGGVPKFNDMSKLSEEEQEYLYKLVSKSNLEDKLSVPAPSKDSLDKDFHEFEKMKGEILSGNDSKELVKKFKGLIMKLSRNGYLPKGEVNELLELLTSLSY
jgi:hypothetical protein